MELKRAKVIMLPTEEKTDIIYNNSLDLLIHKSNKHFYNHAVDTSKYMSYQHLYFTTDEEIKEGDWFIYLNKIYQATSNTNRNSVWSNFKDFNSIVQYKCRKIIATTDKSLKIEKIATATYKAMFYKDSLPQPSQAFIEKYCKEGGIDKVMVEYKPVNKDYNNPFNNPLKLHDYKLKIDSHNTITIHPIKDSWDRKEMEVKCKLAFLDGAQAMYNTSHCKKSWTFHGTQLSEQWVKEKL